MGVIGLRQAGSVQGQPLSPNDLVGRTIEAVTGAWHVHDGVKSSNPDPLWFKVEGLGQVRFGCAGRGDVNLVVAGPVGVDMGTYGRVEVGPWENVTSSSLVGSVIQGVEPLFYVPQDSQVGVLLTTTQGSIAVANLADELHVGLWPSDAWEAEEVSIRG